MAPSVDDQESRVLRITGRIHDLPTLPSVLQQINQLLMNPRTSARDVGKVIGSDPSLVSKILRVVNSPFYGLSNRVTSITQAIVSLGFTTVKSLVLSTSIFDLFRMSRNGSDFNPEEFWKHSLGCGAAARVLCRTINEGDPEEFFIAGLLHDLGKTVFELHMHDEYVRARDHCRKNRGLILDSERAVMGVTHAEVGSWVFEKWNLPPMLVAATRYHHQPRQAGEHRKAAAVIHLADIFARALRFGNGGDERIPAIDTAAWADLSVAENQLPALLGITAVEIEKAAVFLDLAK